MTPGVGKLSRIPGRSQPDFGLQSEMICVLAFGALIAACALLGGSSRADAVQLLVLRPALVLILIAMLLQPGAFDLARRNPLIWMLAVLAAVIALGLLPLPLDLWSSLGARERYRDVAEGAGATWLLLSLAPDRTMNSLLALMPALAACVGALLLAQRRLSLVIATLIAAGASSAVLGLLQIVQGRAAPFYLYETTHRGLATGWFANRNHEAAFLVCLIPLCALWALLHGKILRSSQQRATLAAALILFFVASIFVTGSRSGLLLMAASLVMTILVLWRFLLAAVPSRLVTFAIAGGVAALAGFVAFIFYAGRALSVDRLLNIDIAEDQRIRNAPAVMEATRDMMPAGTGFGAFDPVFRGYESDQFLRPTYLNNAHNDLLELAMTGGAPALLLLAAFLFWFGLGAIRVFFFARASSDAIYAGRFAAIGIAVLLLASLTDYPLRTPLLGAVFAVLCVLLEYARAAPARRKAVVATEPGGG